ncbi:MAG: polysaccharide pyruvyl transferase family protein [Clostridia bacterium]|nr:polysaccharide pyruvyl transferase family protein [Clostridia bacterium]
MKKTVGIATLHTSINYGVFLQAYALQEKIRSLGYDTRIINYDKRIDKERKPTRLQRISRTWAHVKGFREIVERKKFRSIPQSKRREREFARFSNERFDFTPYCNNCDDVRTFADERFDACVCGSDQIWNPNHTQMNPFYYLDFVPSEKKIAYSPSVSCVSIPEQYKDDFYKKVGDFRFISTREKTGSNLVEQGLKKPCPTVIDPTLLFDRDYYDRLAVQSRLVEGKYILCYFLNFSPLHHKAVQAVKEKYGLQVVAIPCAPQAYTQLEGEKIFASVEEFLALVRDAEFVLTDSFHGTSFSTIYRKPFYSIKNYGDEGKFTRLFDFLSTIGLENRIVTKDNADRLTAEPIDYSAAEEKLEEWIAFSSKYLKDALAQTVGAPEADEAKENVSLYYREDCYGCSECANVCPTGAVAMKPDEKTGYLYPSVDDAKCIDCKLCYKKCIINRENRIRINESESSKYFVAKTTDRDVHLNSSSGGIFFTFAKKFVEDGGFICGAVYDDDFSGVHHVLTNDLETVKKMRGSKYVQSDKKNVFCEIKEKLESGKKVLFSGAPCEADALRVFLGKEQEGLLTMSYICHGPTAPRVLKEFSASLSKGKNSKIVDMNMRYKKDGKIFPLHLKADFENGESYCEDSFHSSFSRIFRSDIVMRPSCTKCEFKMMPQFCDVLIGDKGKLNFEGEDAAGNSVVFLFTEKALKAFGEIENSIDVIEVPKEKMINCSERLYSPAKPKKRESTQRFLEILEEDGIDKAADYALPIPSKKSALRAKINSAGRKILKKIGV